MAGGSRAAFLTGLALLLLGAALAAALIPWDSAVAPWAPLDFPASLQAVGQETALAIADYAAAAWLPGTLGLLAAPAVAAAVVLSKR